MDARFVALRTVETQPISQPADGDTLTPFLEGITIKHGPIPLLGQFLLLADSAARRRDVRLYFSSMDELADINKRNANSWRPILPHYDVAYGGITSENAFCIIGRNAVGDVVATQAARLYDWTETTLMAEAATLRLFYPKPGEMAHGGERCIITAPAAASISGRVAFTGAAWYRPDYRGRDLATVLPRIARAYAFAKWHTDFNVTFIADRLVETGLPRRCGYTNVQFAVELENFAIGRYRGALVWMATDEMLNDVSHLVSSGFAQVDAGIQKRRA
jgi:hypothetical protein